MLTKQNTQNEKVSAIMKLEEMWVRKWKKHMKLAYITWHFLS